MAIHTYDVPSISCDHCRQTIEAAVSALDAVDSAVVDIEARTVTVAGTSEADSVRAAIEAAGYPVANVSAPA